MIDSQAIWKRLTSVVKEFHALEVASTRSTADLGVSIKLSAIRFAIAQEIAGAFIRLAKQAPSELRYYRKAIAKQLGVADFERWLENQLENQQGDDENSYRLAHNYSTACIYAGEYVSALHFWMYALTSSRALPGASETINAEGVSQYDSLLVHQDLAREFMGFARKHLAGKQDFIDLCCGSGLSAAYLDLPGSRITGIDLDLGGLAAAGRGHCFHHLLEGSVEVMLPRLAEEGFDAIWCCAGVYFFPDLRFLFEQASRRLRPGGILAFNVWPGSDQHKPQITRSGTHRYCHSKAYLERCATDAGFSLSDFEWRVVYNMPNWFMAFQKNGHS